MALLHVKNLFLGAVTTTTGTGSTAFTVPSGHRYVVRNILMRNLSSSATFSLLVYIDGILVYSRTLSPSESAQVDLWVVMGASSVMSLRVGNSAGIDVTISGSDYTI